MLVVEHFVKGVPPRSGHGYGCWHREGQSGTIPLGLLPVARVLTAARPVDRNLVVRTIACSKLARAMPSGLGPNVEVGARK